MHFFFTSDVPLLVTKLSTRGTRHINLTQDRYLKKNKKKTTENVLTLVQEFIAYPYMDFQNHGYPYGYPWFFYVSIQLSMHLWVPTLISKHGYPNMDIHIRTFYNVLEHEYPRMNIHVLWKSVSNYPWFYLGYPLIYRDIHAWTCYGFSIQGIVRENSCGYVSRSGISWWISIDGKYKITASHFIKNSILGSLSTWRVLKPSKRALKVGNGAALAPIRALDKTSRVFYYLGCVTSVTPHQVR